MTWEAGIPEITPAQSAVLVAQVAALSLPQAYAEPTAAVTAIETHMSWVFLTDRHAYKLKKPVCREYLDFSTLEQRHHYCEEEVRLNRRLAPQVYLGVARLTRSGDGRLVVDGTGRTVDFLVKMRRLPAAGMLDNIIAARTLRRGDLRALVTTLAAFYARAGRIAVEPAIYHDAFVDGIGRTGRTLAESRYALPAKLVEWLTRVQLRFAVVNPKLFKARSTRVVEAHGDLRAEHVHLGPPIQIIDCLEFRRDLRQLDPIDEVAFLALECERLGAPLCARYLLRHFQRQTADAVPAQLIDFYQCYRACIRAKLAVWHLNDGAVANRGHWRQRALDYLALARLRALALEQSAPLQRGRA